MTKSERERDRARSRLPRVATALPRPHPAPSAVPYRPRDVSGRGGDVAAKSAGPGRRCDYAAGALHP